MTRSRAALAALGLLAGAESVAAQAAAPQAPAATPAQNPSKDSESAAALAARATALQKDGRLDEAAEAYHRFLALVPASWEGHSNLGVVYAQLGRHEDAVKEYREALRLKPGQNVVRYNLALALIKGGRTARGRDGARDDPEGRARPQARRAAARRLPPSARRVEAGDRDPRPAARAGPGERGGPLHARHGADARQAVRARAARARPDPEPRRLGRGAPRCSRSRAARPTTTSPRSASSRKRSRSTRSCRPPTACSGPCCSRWASTPGGRAGLRARARGEPERLRVAPAARPDPASGVRPGAGARTPRAGARAAPGRPGRSLPARARRDSRG